VEISKKWVKDIVMTITKNTKKHSSVLAETLLFFSFVLICFTANLWSVDMAIQYRLKQGGQVSLALYDKQGGIVRTLLYGAQKKAGKHTIYWDGLDRYGDPVSQGTYNWKMLRTPGFQAKYITRVGTNVPPSKFWPGNHQGVSAVAVAKGELYATSTNTENIYTTAKVSLDGKKYFWGARFPAGQSRGCSGGIRLAYTDKWVYQLHKDGLLVPFRPKNGRVPRIKKSWQMYHPTNVYKWDALLPGQKKQTWRGDKHIMDLDTHEGQVVLSYRDHNLLRWVTPESSPIKKQKPYGKLLSKKEVRVKKPLAMALKSRNRAFVITQGQVVEIDMFGRQSRIIPLGKLKNPRFLDFDHKNKELLVVEGAPDHRIKRFDLKGKMIKAYGRQGGRRFGLYQAEDFLNVCDIAVDGQGGFVIVEEKLRRTAHFNRAGQCLTEWFGGQSFYTFSCADPKNPERVFSGFGYNLLAESQINMAKGTWSLKAVYDLSELPLSPAAPSGHTRWYVRHKKGRLYFIVNSARGPAVMALNEKKKTLRTIARVVIRPRGQQKHLEKQGQKPHSFTWSDLNADGKVQEKEKRYAKSKKAKGLNHLHQKIFAYHVHIDENWNIYLPNSHNNPKHNKAIAWFFMPNLAGKNAAIPVWDWNKIQASKAVMPQWDRKQFGMMGSSGIFRDMEGNIYQQLTNADRKMNDGDSWPTHRHGRVRLVKWHPSGKVAWSTACHASRAAGDVIKLSDPGRLHEPVGIIGEVKNCILSADKVVRPITVWTKDGLYAGSFFDRRSKDGLPPQVYAWWRADFKHPHGPVPYDCLIAGTAVERKNGQVLWLSQGNQDNPVYAISGWKGWERQKGSVRIKKERRKVSWEGRGLRAAYYNNADFSGRAVVESAEGPIHFGPKHFNKVFRQTKRKKPISVRWQGKMEAPLNDSYMFTVKTAYKAHVRLWVNGKKIIDTSTWDSKQPKGGWHVMNRHRKARKYSEKIQLKAGQKYPVKLEYFAKPQGRRKKKLPKLYIRFMWQNVAQERAVVPKGALY